MLSPFPSRVTLELTNACNLACAFCPRRFMEKERGFMDVSLAFSLLDEMAEHSPVALVPFFRGESLLHPRFDTILTHARQVGLGPIQMATNASLLSKEKAEALLEIGIDFLSFSMDTLDPELYKTLRGADYAQSLDNILYFLRRRDERGAPTRVQVSAVETPQSAGTIAGFIEFWKTRADRIRTYPEHSTEGCVGSMAAPPLSKENRRPCHKPFEEMVILWDGEVALCNHDWTRKISGCFIADAAADGIYNAWHSEGYRAIRLAHLQNALSGVSPCAGCDYWAVRYAPDSPAWGRTITKILPPGG